MRVLRKRPAVQPPQAAPSSKASTEASTRLVRRRKLRLVMTSSTAATVQVAPRWIAKPITPAHKAASA